MDVIINADKLKTLDGSGRLTGRWLGQVGIVLGIPGGQSAKLGGDAADVDVTLVAGSPATPGAGGRGVASEDINFLTAC